MSIDRFTPVLGMILMLGIAFLLSRDRKRALEQWPLIVWGLGLQFVFALFVLKTKAGEVFFSAVNDFFIKIVALKDFEHIQNSIPVFAVDIHSQINVRILNGLFHIF